MIGVSVVVCCYNSALRINDTLKYLTLQEIEKSIPWEVILVDNNCSDNTVDIARKVWFTSKLADDKLVIIKETKPGLSEARKTGVHKAKYSCIVFCDDDNWLDCKYLETAFNLLANNQSIGVIGSKSIEVSEINWPIWWSKYKSNFAVGEQSAFSGDITNRKFVWGAGMVTRKELYQKCFPQKFPSLLIDRKGDILGSGGDSEFCARLLLLGYKIYYSDTLVLNHFISKERLTDEYLKKIMEGHMASYLILKKYYAVIENQHLTFSGKLKNTLSVIKNFRSSFISEIFFIWTGRSLHDQDINLIHQFTLFSKV